MKTDILVAGSVLLAGCSAENSVPRQLYDRAACNRDNLFRCFIDQRYSVQASGYCSGLSPFTATVAVVTATSTITTQTEVTRDPITITETSTTTVFTETVPTATTTVTLENAAPAKRQAVQAPPKCMTNGVTYPASRITSACSCIDVPAETISVTHTASTDTVTETVTVDTTPSVTITDWKTISTATTGGVFTVTVTPDPLNTGNAGVWQFATGSFIQDPSTNTYCQQLLLPLEAGSYQFTFYTVVAVFPLNTNAFAANIALDLINPTKGTTITATFQDAKRVIVDKKYLILADRTVQVDENAAGNSRLCMRALAGSFYGGYVQDLTLRKL